MDLEAIRTASRNKADENTTGYIDSDNLDQSINQGYFYVYAKIANAFEGYFEEAQTEFDTVVGRQGYATPTDMVKLVRVEWRPAGSTSDDDWIKVHKDNRGNENPNYRYSPHVHYRPVMKYVLAGNKIYLRPVPNTVFEMRMWTVMTPDLLEDGTDVPVIPAIYHPLIAEYAALQMLAQSGEGIYQERRDAFEIELNNLIETIKPRDQEPDSMVSTEFDDDYEDLRIADS